MGAGYPLADEMEGFKVGHAHNLPVQKGSLERLHPPLALLWGRAVEENLPSQQNNWAGQERGRDSQFKRLNPDCEQSSWSAMAITGALHGVLRTAFAPRQAQGEGGRVPMNRLDLCGLEAEHRTCPRSGWTMTSCVAFPELLPGQEREQPSRSYAFLKASPALKSFSLR